MGGTKKTNHFFIFLLIILTLTLSIIFLILKNNSEENRQKNSSKIIAENEKIQMDSEEESVKETTVSMYENFGKGEERFTEKEKFYEMDRKRIRLSSSEICREIGCDPYTLTEYLTVFAWQQKAECSSGTILDYRYVETEDASRKIQIFIQLDDEKKTLATAVFAPAEINRAAYYDVLPCQYSLEEIQRQAWYEKEVQ